MADGSNKLAFAAATGGFAATLFTGIACVGPLIAILLGVGGFGWLTRYAYLRVPASLTTAALLAAGFYWVYFRGCPRNAKTRLARIVLWSTTLLAVALNVFEYVIFPRLG